MSLKHWFTAMKKLRARSVTGRNFRLYSLYLRFLQKRLRPPLLPRVVAVAAAILAVPERVRGRTSIDKPPANKMVLEYFQR